MRVLRLNDPKGKILTQHCAEVTDPITQVVPFVTQALDEVERLSGMGVAAPQIGQLYRWYVDYKRELHINPEILSQSDEVEIMEGCLSLPRKWYTALRFQTVELRYFNTEMEEQIITVEGLDAFVAQHEIDHLNGRLVNEHGKRVYR
jgi:peptide deformylase